MLKKQFDIGDIFFLLDYKRIKLCMIIGFFDLIDYQLCI
jgi:hypothetical protein